jgi:hypothetical protein
MAVPKEIASRGQVRATHGNCYSFRAAISCAYRRHGGLGWSRRPEGNVLDTVGLRVPGYEHSPMESMIRFWCDTGHVVA